LNPSARPFASILKRSLLLLTCALSGFVHGSTATPYGEQFVRPGQQWSDGGPPVEPGPESGEVAQAHRQYLRQMAALEDQGGPYADALAEPLASLGRHYRLRGDLENAQRVYRRALHVVRVNDGLHSRRQLPILRELLQLYRDAGDMTSLDERYDYYFRLYGSGSAPFTDARLRAGLEYLRWQREAVRLGIDGQDLRRLVKLIELNEAIIRDVALDSSLDPVWYRQLVYSQLRNLYLLQDRAQPRIEETGMLQNSLFYLATEQDPGGHELRLATLQRGAFARGASLLQTLIGRMPAEAPAALARARLELGDWYQWNGATERAADEYTDAVALLREAGEARLLERWFAQPVELPDNGAFWQPQQLPEGKRKVLLEAVYDVSATGRPGNIEATVVEAGDDGAAYRLRRQLAGTRFRPRWLEGRPEEVTRLVRTYELVD
jgi:tetratricopeptide (TPR) repeat protein